MTRRFTAEDRARGRRLLREDAERLGHCTPTLGGHSPACDRDGTYCGEVSTHAGPCTPHGSPRASDRRRVPGGRPTCVECGRTFDLAADPEDAAEWIYGHDCEPAS